MFQSFESLLKESRSAVMAAVAGRRPFGLVEVGWWGMACEDLRKKSSPGQQMLGIGWWDGCGDNFQIQWLLVNDRDVLEGQMPTPLKFNFFP